MSAVFRCAPWQSRNGWSGCGETGVGWWLRLGTAPSFWISSALLGRRVLPLLARLKSGGVRGRKGGMVVLSERMCKSR